jgi:hypothetical protein
MQYYQPCHWFDNGVERTTILGAAGMLMPPAAAAHERQWGVAVGFEGLKEPLDQPLFSLLAVRHPSML